ncbi:MAG: hypothetical protein ACR2NZ_08075 [Rubripirellula sp.]
MPCDTTTRGIQILREIPNSFGKEVHDAWGDEACIRYLAGEYNEDELRDAIEGRHFGSTMIGLTIAFKNLAAGKRRLAKQHFQLCVDLNQILTFDYGFAEAYLSKMNTDPNWPEWSSENGD